MVKISRDIFSKFNSGFTLSREGWRFSSVCEKILPDLDNSPNDIIMPGLPAYFAGRP
jgi:hypothetical protein